MALNPGDRLGAYEIVSLLGEGGMGQVYRARDPKLARDVAIKVLPDLLAKDPERLARFEREAQVLASLNHPNIAHIHGFEDSTGVAALVMELVEGPTLADRIARGPLPMDEALSIAKQIADGLEAAHEQSIVHRDLKPANIKVRDDGTVKILDFGLAKAIETPNATNPSVTQSPTLTFAGTQIGVILGTAAYMSPEQAKGRAADKRSDLWAFGCVLYEMLTGKRVFEGEDVGDTLAFIITKQPDFSVLPTQTPASIHKLLRRCLEKDRRRRLADAADARLEIEDASTAAEPTSAVALPHRRRLRPGVAVASIVAAVLFTAIGVIVGREFRRTAATAPVRFAITIPESQARFFRSQTRQAIAISPDGTQVVYSANERLYLRGLSDFEDRPIVGSDLGANAINPVFSPDGQSVAFVAGDRTLRKLAIKGGAPVTLCSVGNNPWGMSWDADGILVGLGGSGIVRVAANGGAPKHIVTMKADEVAFGPQMVAGTEWLLFTLASGRIAQDWDTARIVVESLRSHERRTLIDGGSDARLLPTGHLVYALGGIVFAAPFDSRAAVLQGPATPVIEGVSRGGAVGSAQFSTSNTGVLVYAPGPLRSGTGELDLGEGIEEMKRFGLPPGSYAVPRISPDGKQVAYGAESANQADVWIYDLARTTAPRRLTFGGKNRFPAWSADGQRIAFQSDREGDPGIFWQRADGSGAVERLTKAEAGTVHAPESFSPRDDRLLYRIEKGASVSLSVLSLSDRKTEPFANVRSTNPTNAVFSPDGRWVAYASQEAGSRLAVYVQPFPPTGAKYQVPATLPGDGSTRHPVWSPDGIALYYNSGPGLTASVRITTQPTLAFGVPAVLPPNASRIGSALLRNFDVMRDGRTLVSVINPTVGPTSGSGTAQINVVLNWFDELKARVPIR